jgi:hypothetical protein
MQTTIAPGQINRLLSNLRPGVKIGVMKTPNGEIVIDAPKTREEIIKERYAKLIGKPITALEAEKKYGVIKSTIHRWRAKGYITVLEGDYQMQLNEAEVAYCVDTYRAQQEQGQARAPLFDEHGLPYRLKHPKLSAYRRKKSN